MNTAASRSLPSEAVGLQSPSLGQSPFVRLPALARFAWGVLGFNLLVILWGAFVRASRSGDGCGGHWPFCNGQVVPTVAVSGASKFQTIVEFSHRFSSGLALVGVLALCIWVWRSLPRGHQARLFAAWSSVFILLEGALGAGLVLFRLVAGNTSLTRAVYLSAHLTNTLLLIGALTLTAWLASHPGAGIHVKSLPRSLVAALALAVFVSITGAVAALGDTLFPAVSLAGGLRADFASTAPILLRLRLFHPVIAGISGLCILLIALTLSRRIPAQPVREMGALIVLMVLIQFALGAANVALLGPIWMQLTHLLASQILWICLILFAAEIGSSNLVKAVDSLP